MYYPPSEFAAAVDEAKRSGTTKIFCGDQDAQTSIVHASVVVRAIKPDILFLELDKKRARNIHKVWPHSEFVDAVDEAKRLVTIKIFCGDQGAQV
ncbi:hypothetical protein P8452_59078 [Trifolium repens]|nr:hypothetical protein P8452_59078 [Trifolium repens]